MKERLKRINEERGRLIKEMREMLDAAEQEKRDLTSEEDDKYQRMEADYDKLEKEAERLERAIERESRAAESNGRQHREDPEDRGTGDGDAEDEQRMAAFDAFLRSGMNGLTMEQRDMLAGSDVDGGYLVAPQRMVAGILKELDKAVNVRSMATIHTLKQAASLGVVKMDSDIEDWEWTTELATGQDDEGLKFGKRELRPHPVAKRVKMSKTLIRLSTRNVQQLVRDRMSYKLGATMEYNYMMGDGVQKPLGLFTPSDDGIPTSRDVSTDMTATEITGDGLISVQGALRDGYQARARWLFHRDAITRIRKLKDGNGQYIWQPGLAQGTKNMILGKPYVVSEFCPNTFATGQYVGMYGDFSFYWIVDSLQMQIQVLKELYAESNKIGYIGRYEGDAQPVLEEAFCRIKLA